jgi:hypothetical protein
MGEWTCLNDQVISILIWSFFMLHGFNLKITESDIDSNFYGVEPLDRIDDDNELRTSLKSIVEDDEIINGAKMEEIWFPKIQGKHVFISHSHGDVELALKLAGWLKQRFGLESFIDSTVWGYADKLLNMIDDKYCKIKGKDFYDYGRARVSASNVYISLSKALDAVIDCCECLIFINTDNSTEKTSLASQIRKQDSTYSPWIMSELRTSEIIRKVSVINRQTSEKSLITDSVDDPLLKSMPLSVSYALPTHHLHQLDISKLKKWSERNECFNIGYDALTDLYNVASGVVYEQHIRKPTQRSENRGQRVILSRSNASRSCPDGKQ